MLALLLKLVLYFYMSKAFDKVWHYVLIFKLKSVGVSESLISLIESFLNNSFQSVMLNEQTSECLLVKTGVLQGSWTTFFPYLH